MQRMPSLLESRTPFIALCGHLLKKVKPAEVSFNVHWIFSQFKIMSLRRCDLMAIDLGRLMNKRTIILPIIWERDAKREYFEGIHNRFPKRSCVFVNLNSKIDRTEEVGIRWTRTRRKISLIEWRKMSTLDTKRIGGSLSISLEKSDRWEIAWLQRCVDPH